MHWGTAPGVTSTVVGEVQGQPTVTLIGAQLPSHTHSATAAKGSGGERSPIPTNTSYLAGVAAPDQVYQSAPTSWTAFAPNTISPAGNSQPHDNMSPYLTINFCIALQGTFPSRS